MPPDRRDHAATPSHPIVAIEQASFPNAWSREVLAEWIQRSDSDWRGRVVGFLLVGYD